jgi:hypothetical protein
MLGMPRFGPRASDGRSCRSLRPRIGGARVSQLPVVAGGRLPASPREVDLAGFDPVAGGASHLEADGLAAAAVQHLDGSAALV